MAKALLGLFILIIIVCLLSGITCTEMIGAALNPPKPAPMEVIPDQPATHPTFSR